MQTPLTVKVAAKRLNVHEETIRRWIHSEELEVIRVGRAFVISEESLALKEKEKSRDKEAVA